MTPGCASGCAFGTAVWDTHAASLSEIQRNLPFGNGGLQIGTEGDLFAVCPSKDNRIHFGSNF